MIRLFIFLAISLFICRRSFASPPTFAHSTVPGRDVPQIMLVVAYKEGAPVAAQAVGFAPSLDDCEQGLQAELAAAGETPGVVYVAVCTPIPPSR